MSTFHGWQCDECGKRKEREGIKHGDRDSTLPGGWACVHVESHVLSAAYSEHVPRCLTGRHTFCSPSCAATWITETPARVKRKWEAECAAREAAREARAALP